jgi:hypothetical protein
MSNTVNDHQDGRGEGSLLTFSVVRRLGLGGLEPGHGAGGARAVDEPCPRRGEDAVDPGSVDGDEVHTRGLLHEAGIGVAL